MSQAKRNGGADRRDTELSFLKQSNIDQPLITHQGHQGQKENKRTRSSSDQDDEFQVVGNGTPKKAKSIQRGSRTILNSNMTTTGAMIALNSGRMDCRDNNRQNGQNVLMSSDRNEEQTDVGNRPHVADSQEFQITRHALAYAAEQHLPSIKLECTPKVNDHKQASLLIKELLKFIEPEFRRINRSYNHTLAFETWFVDNTGDLVCITREIELFVYLCDINHVPTRLLTTDITPVLPKRLPPQRSIVIKFVPRTVQLVDVRSEIESKFSSIYALEEMNGTGNGKTRHMRMDVTNVDEYRQILNSGLISIEGQLFEVSEFLAPPRLLICSKCNEPGHMKKNCSSSFERCRRCGHDRTVGEHKSCTIKCHNCQGEHMSTDYKCPSIACFRRELILRLQQHPEKLPAEVQLFIPFEYRQHGEKILYNRQTHTRQQQTVAHQAYIHNSAAWQPLPPAARPTIPFSAFSGSTTNESNNIWSEMNKFEIEFARAKADFERQNIEITTKVQSSVAKIQSIVASFSTVIQRQNEAIQVLKTSIKETLEYVRITNHALCVIMTKTGDQQYTEIVQQLSSLPIVERQSSLDQLFSTIGPSIDNFMVKMMEMSNTMLASNG